MTVVSNRRAGSEPGPAPPRSSSGSTMSNGGWATPRHAAQFFTSGFGFAVEAYAGPETGQRDRVSYVLRQGDIRFVVTSAARRHVRDRGSRPPAR